VLLKCQTLPSNVHNSDTGVSLLTGSSTSSVGMPCASHTGALGGSVSISITATGPPQYDISFVFQDNNKLAKNAKRSYESQVCDAVVDVIFPCYFVLFMFFFCFCFSFTYLHTVF